MIDWTQDLLRSGTRLGGRSLRATVPVSRGTARLEPESAAVLHTIGVCRSTRWSSVGNRGPGSLRRENRGTPRREHQCASLGWRDRAGATWQPRIKWLWDPEVPLRSGKPGGDGAWAGAQVRCRSASAKPELLGRLLWESRGGTLITCALSAPRRASRRGRSRKRDWHTGK